MFVFVLLGKVKWGFKDYPIIIPLCFLHMNYLLPLIIMTIIISWSWWCDDDMGGEKRIMGTYGKRYKGLMVMVGPLNKNGTFRPTASDWTKKRSWLLVDKNVVTFRPERHKFLGFYCPTISSLTILRPIHQFFSQPKCLHIFAQQFFWLVLKFQHHHHLVCFSHFCYSFPNNKSDKITNCFSRPTSRRCKVIWENKRCFKYVLDYT